MRKPGLQPPPLRKIDEKNSYKSTALLKKCSIFERKKVNIKKYISMQNEIKKVYTGSFINAEFIGSVLEENGIKFLIRNYQQEGLLAGWAPNVIKGDASVYVFTEDYDKAMLLLDEIKESEIEE